MKKIIAGAVALTLAGAGLALAQQAQTSPREVPSSRVSNEDVAAFTDARVAGLKAGLKLTAEQEKNWPAFEKAIRDRAKERADRRKERMDRREASRSGENSQQSRPDAIARLRQGADAMAARSASQKKFADAAEPLYKSFDDGQKKRFGALLRMGGRFEGGHGRWQRRADNRR